MAVLGFAYASIDGYLGHFHFLTVKSDVAMNFHIQVHEDEKPHF